MTYIDYLNQFDRWLEQADRVADKSVVLYYAFLSMFNRRGWPTWAGVDTQRLMMMARATNKNIAFRARDQLVNAGLIEKKSGSRKQSCEYRLCELGYKFDTENITERVTENVPPNKTKTKNNTPLLSPQGETRKRFSPPTVDEVREYCQSRSNGIDPEAFIAFYASKGWKVGRSPMKDWKQAVITWEKRRKQEGEEEDIYAKFT